MTLYVSAKKGSLVPRCGTSTYVGAQIVGVDPATGGGLIEWNSDEVVSIPDAEVRAYSKEYRSELADGSLIQRDEAAYKAWLAKLEKRSKEDEERVKKEAAEAKASAKKAEAEREGEAGGATSKQEP